MKCGYSINKSGLIVILSKVYFVEELRNTLGCIYPLYSPCYNYAIHHYTVPAICHTPLYSPCYMPYTTIQSLLYAIHHYTVPAILKIGAETNTTDIPIFVHFAIFGHNFMLYIRLFVCNHAGLHMYIFSTMELGCT